MIRNFFGRHRIVFFIILFLGIILSCSCAEKHTGSADLVKNPENTSAVDSDTSGHSGKSNSPQTSGMDENTSIRWADLIKTDSMDLTYATQFAVDYYQGDYALITIAGQQKYLLLPNGSADDAANTSDNAKDESDPGISDNTTAKSDPDISDNPAVKPDPDISDSAGNIPEDLPDDIVVLKRNPQRVYIASSSCMDFWRELDELDAVWFTSTKRQDWDLPEAAERMTDGDLEFVGKYNAPDFEYLLAENCGLAVENTMIYHTPDMLDAADPATAIRLTQAITTVGMWLVPSLLFAYCQDRQWFGYNAADRRPKQSMVNMVLILSVTLLPVVGVLSSFNQHIMPQEGSVAGFMRHLEEAAEAILQVVTSQRDSWSLISNLLVFAVLAGVCEEFFFQGALQPLLMNWTKNPHVGILLTALIFSTMHFQFYGFIPRFALGLYLGYLLYWSRSLWLPILAHVLHNALSLLVDYTLQGRGIDTDNLQYTDVRGSLPLAAVCTLVSAMAIVYLWRTYRDGQHGPSI